MKFEKRPILFASLVFFADLFYWFSDTGDDQYYNSSNKFTIFTNRIIESSIGKLEWFFLGADDANHPVVYITNMIFDTLDGTFFGYVAFFIFVVSRPFLIFILWYFVGKVIFRFWDLFYRNISDRGGA